MSRRAAAQAAVAELEASDQPTPPRPWPEKALRAVIALSMVSMMVVTTADVALRYLFSAPLTGSYELVQVLLGLAVFSALPLAARYDAHVNISLLDGLFKGLADKLRRIAVMLASAVVVGFISRRLWLLGERLMDNNRTIGALELPIGPFALLFSVFAAITVLVHLYMVWLLLRAPRADAGGEA
ncbi:TRAP transporter small permease [Alkalilimnicola sp. S0819]|uniref:TRAP transporter small permease n=1 Tax=Alkalilimnicola sp. S0819 TaxID=2613922 RepID=UPI0012628473|nr:TRAP transporter small permease [Alkalilimnicola sp. S0819]KAB7619521.1 TRAP transporter small permease [Alkalilimnicola sp. S0819]MPQ17670.1 TRAP transporter small permease subunit [Alkalilimnicola sp. S0819]